VKDLLLQQHADLVRERIVVLVAQTPVVHDLDRHLVGMEREQLSGPASAVQDDLRIGVAAQFEMALHHLAPLEGSLLLVGPRGDELVDRVLGRKVLAAVVELAINASLSVNHLHRNQQLS